jgi:photosystem II stability/assembly factor-like uncharacterized protein
MKLILSLMFATVWGLTFCAVVFAQEAIADKTLPLLPRPWLGVWRGEVKAEGPNGRVDTFQMELEIGEHSDPQRLKWKMTYDGSQGMSVRNYELVANDVVTGRYAIDEGNGINIATSKIGSVLYSNFSVGGQTLTTRYELLDEKPAVLSFELVASPSQPAMTSRVENLEVVSLQPNTRQTARLKQVVDTLQSRPDIQDRRTVWEKLKTETYRGKQDDIYFVNDRIGWYANGAGKIYKTSDGGTTWQKQLDQPGTYFRCLAFLDENHGYAGNIGPGYFPNVLDSCPLYETKDGGATWQKVTTIEGPPVVGLCALQVLREDFIHAGKLEIRTRLIGVGRVGGPAKMITSDDFGATWQQVNILNLAAMAFDVHFLNRREGFIAASTDVDVANSHALILRTQDGGESWTKVYESSRPYELTWKISFPSRKVGYVTIQSYNPDPKIGERFVAKSIDGGETWKEIPLVTNAAVREFGIAFLNEKIGWVGAMPHGFFTSDGGDSWVKANLGNAVNKIRFVPGDKKTWVYAIGSEVHRLEIPDGEF